MSYANSHPGPPQPPVEHERDETGRATRTSSEPLAPPKRAAVPLPPHMRQQFEQFVPNQFEQFVPGPAPSSDAHEPAASSDLPKADEGNPFTGDKSRPSRTIGEMLSKESQPPPICAQPGPQPEHTGNESGPESVTPAPDAPRPYTYTSFMPVEQTEDSQPVAPQPYTGFQPGREGIAAPPQPSYGPHPSVSGLGVRAKSYPPGSVLSSDNAAGPEPGGRPYNAPAPAHSIDQSAWSTEAAEKTGPRQGWRSGLAKIGVKLPKSASEVEYDRDILRIQRKLAYPHNVIVVGFKGGVGKSTITVGLGSTLAAHRHVSDVVAIDTDTDGSLQQRMPKEQNKPVASDIKRFLRSTKERALSGSEVQVQLFSNSTGLQALVAAEYVGDYSLSATDYADVISTLHGEYMINLVDTSPDRRAPTFAPALASAAAIVLVTVPNADSVNKAARFLEALRDSAREDLLARTVLIWNDAAPGDDVVFNVERTKSEFVRRLSTDSDPSSCLVDIPLDPHLAAGGEINLSLLRKRTRRQFERAAALVMDKLPDRNSYR